MIELRGGPKLLGGAYAKHPPRSQQQTGLLRTCHWPPHEDQCLRRVKTAPPPLCRDNPSSFLRSQSCCSPWSSSQPVRPCPYAGPEDSRHSHKPQLKGTPGLNAQGFVHCLFYVEHEPISTSLLCFPRLPPSLLSQVGPQPWGYGFHTTLGRGPS